MRKLFAFCAILIQPLAMYLQVYDIAANKGYQALFYILGAILILLGIILILKDSNADKNKSYIIIAEGVILLFAPFFASRYVEKMEEWDAHIKYIAAEERFDDLTPYEQYQKAMEFAGPGKWEYLKAFELAHSAASRGCVEAFDLLGELYARGLGCKVDYEAAAFNFVQSSLNGRHTLSEAVKMYPEIREAKDPKVRKVIDECENDFAFLQNTLDELNRHKGHRKDMIKVLDPLKAQLELLSEKGYSVAAGCLFVLANLKGDNEAVSIYSRRLAESYFVPDYPRQRYYIYRYADPNLPQIGDVFGKDELNRLIANEDFFITLHRCDTLSFICMNDDIDSQDFYRYTLAQYNRCKYMKENREKLSSYMARYEDIEAYYKFAVECHIRSINTIEGDLAEKYPPVFGNK